jgi:hypothetical protein
MTEDEKDRRLKHLAQLNWVQIVGLVAVVLERIAVGCY